MNLSSSTACSSLRKVPETEEIKVVTCPAGTDSVGRGLRQALSGHAGVEGAPWRQWVEHVEIQDEEESWGIGRDDGHPERESPAPLWLGTLDVLLIF